MKPFVFLILIGLILIFGLSPLHAQWPLSPPTSQTWTGNNPQIIKNDPEFRLISNHPTNSGFCEFILKGDNAGGVLRFQESLGDLILECDEDDVIIDGEGSVIFNVSDVQKMELTSVGLGIGTSSPDEKLEIHGNMILQGTNQLIKFNSSSGFNRSEIKLTSDNNFEISNNYHSGNLVFNSDHNLFFNTLGNTRMTIDNTTAGNVGIHTTSPMQELDVNGDLALSDLDGKIHFYEGATSKATINYDGDNLELKNDESGGDIILDAKDDLFIRSNGFTRVYMNNVGALGVGTTSPNAKLDVEGDLALSDGNGEIRFQEGGTTKADISYDGLNLTIENNEVSGDINIDAREKILFLADGMTHMQIDTSGNVGIGTNSPSRKLEVKGVVNITGGNTALEIDGKEAIWWTNTGNYVSWGFDSDYNFFDDEVRIGGSGTSAPSYQLEVVGNADVTGEFTAASDARLKKNVRDIGNALKTINDLRPRSYQFRTEDYRDMKLASGVKMGFLAQELEKILPELVSIGSQVTNSDGDTFNSKSVNYIELIPLLTKAIQEQQEIIQSQQVQINKIMTSLQSIYNISDQE